VLESFHPAVRTWFARRFPDGPTEPQAGGWAEIAAGRDTLIAAPTGSGKTLAAFLVCIDRLYRAHEARARVGAESGETAAAGGTGRTRKDARDQAVCAHHPAAGPQADDPAAGPQADDPATGPQADDAAAGPQVVYVSPLKALAVDIWQNLERPLAEIAAVAEELGLPAPSIKVAVRTGDTAAAERTAMLKKPPDFLITTPESLYLLLTAQRPREMLRTVRTVIVDEIHAVAGNKRGSHLALTLERLAHVATEPVQRIGLSATQRPIEAVARLLVGTGDGRSEPDGSPRCAIVDSGHRRELDLALELPGDELGAVATTEQMAEIIDLIAGHVHQHRTTIVFVNTRRMAERVAHELGERLGDGLVAAHHGSLSKERRQRVETRLRGGDLRALVATASLELGIDIGPVELVCQIGSPRSFATFLQRVGRSNHTRTGIPAGRLYPTTRDELVECAALLRGARAGRLDALVIPNCPLDILAQQIVAECSAAEWAQDDLLALFRGAAPFSELQAAEFDEVAALFAEGITTGRGRRAAYLHRDQVNGTVKGRRGARLAALTSGGAIPELGDYRVLAEPDNALVGTVNEDWAIESMAGDIFLLGTTSWRIRRVEPGVVRVEDAHGAPPSVPFWLGEAPGRTVELSEEVCWLRGAIADLLGSDPAGGSGGPSPGASTDPPEGSGGSSPRAHRDQAQAVEWLMAECGIGAAAAETIVAYLSSALAQLGVLPTMDTIVLERFFDEAGGMQLVGHTPFGARLNRALGLALRKRFCVTFDFELQAAASDDAILLSLGPQHSFPLERVPKFLVSGTVEEVVRQAVLTSPMFAARWRWNLNTSLAVLRMRGGKKNPPAIQRMEADDLMAAVFPTLAACQENVAPGPLEIPDQVLVRQTLTDCLHEAMDIDGLKGLVGGIESGRVNVVVRDTTEPSVLAHEILNGRPFTYLDDAPLEERRSRAVPLRRGLPVEPHELARLDPAGIDRVIEQVRPEPRDPDELHDVLLSLVAVRPAEPWAGWFAQLVARGRAVTVRAPAAPLWAAVERLPAIEALFPGAAIEPTQARPLAAGPVEEEAAAASLLRGHLDCRGPSTVTALSEATGLPATLVARGLAVLEQEGFAISGRFTRPDAEQEYCARRLLARIHGYTRQQRRREIEPVTARDFIRFLLRWQHVAAGTRREGRFGVLAVIEQLQGFEAAAGVWENSVLAARVDGYRREWLDELCLSGQVSWGRLSVRDASLGGLVEPGLEEPDLAPGRASRAIRPSRATPITLALRDDLSWLLRAARGDVVPAEPGPGASLEVLNALRSRGALFRHDLVQLTGLPAVEIDRALWDGVARGLVSADGFRAMRALLRRGSRQSFPQPRGLRRGLRGTTGGASGRWSQLPSPLGDADRDELAEAVAEQLAARWGVVFRDLAVRESLAVPWRDVLWAFRRMEARGTIRGGRFVTGFSGEQYAHPDAIDVLRGVRKQPPRGEQVRISASDPLNLTGIVLPGPRIPAISANTVTFTDGAVAGPAAHAAAGEMAAAARVTA
jgi:ATP-dependent helicase Lhr and Lhr-like helicase